MDQIEFCDVLLISKSDLIDDEQLSELKAVLRSLNPEAELIPISKGSTPIDKVVNTGRFNFERAERAPGWLKELRGEHTPETEEYGIGSFVYRARRPFHPQRFFEVLHGDWCGGNLLRSKGFFWLATRPQFAGQWSQAGGFAGMFWKAVPEERWPTDPEYLSSTDDVWEEPFGDMRQELVFIGQNLNQAAITHQLDACLLNDNEMIAGVEAWKQMADPFPSWKH